ncbi:MAG TPA: glycosyltransferase family 39 protein [Candidatus Binatia bacterium]|nr:glycosyltransferase family 39 protein [Candidatus Binatia bacterium]
MTCPEAHPFKTGISRFAKSLREYLFAYALLFSFLFVTHAPLLRLPYFWDEAGYFIPAARDLLLTGSLIPHTTLSNAHPPLVMLWLAFWWKYSAFTPAVTRTAMLMVAAFALLGLWRLARDVARESVAAATVLCTALYPVFFAQSSLAHLDMMAAALTLWGLAMYVERRPAATVAFLVLAALAKETAVVTPLALFAWELLCPTLDRGRGTDAEVLCLYRSKRHAFSFLLCPIPLLLWFAWHHHRTGFYLGNPAYLRYNLQATLTPLRVVLALLLRLWHVFGYLNLWFPVFCALAAMTLAPLDERDGTPRPRIPLNAQLVFAVVLLANVVAQSVAGGAVLARYMLPVVPLVILVCVSTLRRRMRPWLWVVAFTCVAFVVQLFVPPPYRIAPEDTLLYRDYVILHKVAANELSSRYPHARILTAWPASDELTRPFLGYVKQPLDVVTVQNFSPPEMERASGATDQFDVAYLFTTKWEPPHPLLRSLPFGKAMQKRYFDYHQDLLPQPAAGLLGGRVVDYQNRGNEWTALIAIEKIENASAALTGRRQPNPDNPEPE